MKLSEGIALLQGQLDSQLPRSQLWMAGDLHELGVQAVQLEAENGALRESAGGLVKEMDFWFEKGALDTDPIGSAWYHKTRALLTG